MSGNALFRTVFEQAAVGMALFGLDGRFEQINARFCEITGYDAGELRARDFRDITHPDDSAVGVERHEALLAGRITTYSLEKRYVRKNGSVVWVNLTVSARREGGRVVQLLGVVDDVTARKQAEDQVQRLNRALERRVQERTTELSATRERLAYLLTTAPAVIYCATDKYGASFVGDNVRHLLGYRPEELLEDPDFLRKKIHPEDLGRVLAALGNLARAGQVSYRYRIRAADGSYRWLRDDCRLVSEPDSEPKEVVGLWQDVTDLVEAEQKVDSMHAKMIVQEKMATIGQLTATVSHELRNPLGTIHASVSSLQKLWQGQDVRVERALARIERSVVRCDDIINDLLDFSRTRPRRPENTAVDAWLREVLTEQQCPPWVQVSFDLNTGGRVLALDQDRLRRGVVNLFENAVQALGEQRATGEGQTQPAVSVTTRIEDERLKVSLADNGPGMTPEVQARIFEPLYSTKTYGVGLGLPTVKHVVQQEGGGVEIESHLGEGTRVELWLPLAGPALTTDA